MPSTSRTEKDSIVTLLSRNCCLVCVVNLCHTALLATAALPALDKNILIMISGKLDSKRIRRGFNNSGTDNLDDTAPTNLLLTKVSSLEKDLERRQESYVARERAYKTRIQELEEELSFIRQSKTGWMKSDGKMAKLKSMQGQIMKNVELVQDRTSRVLQEQERDLLRAFRARLFDVQTELEKEKGKKEDGAGAWIERSRKLESEVEWAKEVADRLERVNQTLLTENARLKSQFHSQEEDRNFLIVQLVNVKKENAHLKAEYSAIGIENESYQNQVRYRAEQRFLISFLEQYCNVITQ